MSAPAAPAPAPAPGRVHPGDAGAVRAAGDDRLPVTLFGFWIFLMSDAVLFALLFATYGTMQSGMAGGARPGVLSDGASVAAQTALLLTSSLTCGRASLALKHRPDDRALAGWLAVTLVLGLCFLGLEGHDFANMLRAGAGPTRSGALSAFFALVGMHGLHVSIGCLWIAVMLVQTRLRGASGAVASRLMRLALFWHFLDIIWVAIFTLVYLDGTIG